MRRRMRIPGIILLVLIALSFSVSAQEDPEFEARKKKSLENFNKKNWQKFDFSKKLLTKAQLSKLIKDDSIDEPGLLRGIIFGKRGRIFIEQSIQQYLEKQAWYKANPAFKNSILSANERKNIDSIREVEAAKHDFVEPGDLRWWKNKLIPEDKIYAKTSAEWDILIAEIEAIHGKEFPGQEWLQKYFDERYWYKRNPAYSPSVLNEIERKNLEAYIALKNRDRKVAVSVGDMDKFQDALLKEEMLKGLNFNELRIMRNEFFARRGKKFSALGYQDFFIWQDWYRPLKDQSKVKLNKIEEENVKMIKAYENKLREKLSIEELTEEEIGGLFTEDLRIMRNEIFARRGWVFKSKDLQKYFEGQDWYKPDIAFTAESVPSVLTATEFKNISMLKKAEEEAISKFSRIEG